MPPPLPPALIEKLVGAAGATFLSQQAEPITHGTGAASGSVWRLRLEVGTPAGDRVEVHVVRKVLRLLSDGRHAAGAIEPRHWAYWRREAEAYVSGLLPSGPGLRAPECLAVEGDSVYLEEVAGSVPSCDQAAEHLAAWQVDYDASLDREWLARDQLGRRLAVSRLDWTGLEADPGVVELWERRWELLERLGRLPVVRSHGDYSLGNLVGKGSDTVALDWATFGWEPLGFDLAHLALSSGLDPRPAYRAAVPERSRKELDAGFTAALAIIGSSRVHWILSGGQVVPSWYVGFLLEHRPN
ncbi:MAG TPA: phosphotransferase [Acidimicrobiales bacterium]|nr:phosphotransferase [Acidimicrobiales bacterium]